MPGNANVHWRNYRFTLKFPSCNKKSTYVASLTASQLDCRRAHSLGSEEFRNTHFWLLICVRNTLNVALTLLCAVQIALWRRAVVPWSTHCCCCCCCLEVVVWKAQITWSWIYSALMCSWFSRYCDSCVSWQTSLHVVSKKRSASGRQNQKRPQ